MSEPTKCVVAAGDVHFGSQDDLAVVTFERAVTRVNPDEVWLLGDILDAGPFSKFPPRTLAEAAVGDWNRDEIRPAKAFLDRIGRRRGGSPRIIRYWEGNHEQHVERAAVQFGRPLADLYSTISPQTILSHHRKNFKWIPWVDEAGGGFYQPHPRWVIVHGYISTKYSATRNLELYQEYSVLYGHTHRIQTETWRNPITGRTKRAIGVGCLCKLQPMWRHGLPTNWAHGFAVGYFHPGGPRFFSCVIEGGQVVLPDGRLVRA